MGKVYRLSSAIGKKRLPTFKPDEVNFGQAHYSWSINARLYLDGLRAIREIDTIEAPDIYQHDIAHDVARLPADIIHLADKPLELLRPMFGRTNVSIMVWEFAEFSDQPFDGDPRNNQLHMLRRMDDVWCGSSFTQKNLTALGIGARFLPPPVAHFLSEDGESIDDVPYVTLDTDQHHFYPAETLGELFMERSGQTVYLAILAPFDLRKNLRALIEGFLASGASKHSMLLIKLIVDNVGTTVANINGILAKHYDVEAKSENVVFCGAYLTEKQLNSLYGQATFFVTAASAEGLNLPLIEAMSRGIPAISPNHTAMGDYVSAERAIVIPAKRQPAQGQIHALAHKLKTTHYPPTAEAIRDAFDRAAALDEASRTRLGRRGGEFVRKAYGLEEFERRVAEFESGLE